MAAVTIETGPILIVMKITMPDILVVKCNAFLPREKMQTILDNLMAQKETRVILLPSYLEAQIVPDDIEIRFANGNGKCVLIPTKNDRDLAEDKKEKDTVNTVTCEFHCVSSENDFKVGFNGGDKESNNAG